MKKYIVSGLLALVFIISPISVHADAVQDQYQAALVQLITLLQAQVSELMTQLIALQTKQAQVETKVDTIVQNTTPSFGGVVTPTNVSSLPNKLRLDQSCNRTIKQKFLDNGGISQSFVQQDPNSYDFSCRVTAFYGTSNNSKITGEPITFTSGKTGIFTGDIPMLVTATTTNSVTITSHAIQGDCNVNACSGAVVTFVPSPLPDSINFSSNNNYFKISTDDGLMDDQAGN